MQMHSMLLTLLTHLYPSLNPNTLHPNVKPITVSCNLDPKAVLPNLDPTATCPNLDPNTVFCRGNRVERARLYKASNEACFGIQIATNAIHEGLAAAKLAAEAGASWIDLNCGCPIYGERCFNTQNPAVALFLNPSDDQDNHHCING